MIDPSAHIPDPEHVRHFLEDLQTRIKEAFRFRDPSARLQRDEWNRPSGGGGKSMVIADGDILEKGGVNFSDVTGRNLPPSATDLRPGLADRPFRAMGVSVVIHPRNPQAPTTHFNVRFFSTTGPVDNNTTHVWWFGGGFDLTPYYLDPADAVHWHTIAKACCDPFGESLYPRFKKQCDDYFFLPHRNEARGIGGIFFDDFNELGADRSFAFTRSVGDAFLRAYLPIFDRRINLPTSDRERQFQLYRRGRYAEFNLLYDRGTRFGLQSNGRTESILMSLPPMARWDYDWKPQPDSPENDLYETFLKPRDWVSQHAPASIHNS